MVSWHRELHDAARKIADEHGLTDYRIKYGGKHLKVLLRYGEQERTVVASATPSDRQAIHNVRRDLRRTARLLLPGTAPEFVPAVAEPAPVIAAPAIVSAPPKTPDVLFHHTTSLDLPWIVMDGEVGDDDDYTYATSSPDGDRCSNAHGYRNVYREGCLLRVRIAMPGELFRPWREVLEENGDHGLIAGHGKLARERGQRTDCWYARRGPLSLDDCYAVHARSYTTHKWVELGATDLSGKVGVTPIIVPPGAPYPQGVYLAIHFGGKFYLLKDEDGADGVRYVSVVMDEDDFLDALAPPNPEPKLAIQYEASFARGRPT